MADPPRRPVFHYTPSRNWMNDPNGLIFHRGLWHMFYQYNPHGTDWGHMSWGHAVSADLLRWREMPLAIAEDDGVMIFSGSVVCDANNTAGFGAGALVAIYTGHRAGPPRSETQHLAFSLDDGQGWCKFAGNPVLDLNEADFRDPKVFWHDASGRWIMVVSLASRREIVLFASADLRAWRELSRVGAADTPGALWECPDLYPLTAPDGVTHWVLKVDVFQGGVAGGSSGLAFVGDFDGTRFVPHRTGTGGAMWQWLDFGHDFYAAASWTDAPDRRRVCIGWMSSHHYARFLPDAPWRGAMSLPREVSLNVDLRLVQLPVREWDRARRVQAVCGPLYTGRARVFDGMPEGPGEIRLVLGQGGTASGRFDLCGPDGCVAITQADGWLSVDRSACGILPGAPGYAVPAKAKLPVLRDLRLVIDHGSVEIFANGGEVTLTEVLAFCPRFDALDVTGLTGEVVLLESILFQT